jgi:hypothetical protein
MTKFYYVAVSNSAHKKIIGSLSSENEKAAREALNKAGMSILSITLEKPSEWDEGKVFEFEILDKTSKKFSGEIISNNEDEIFDKFVDEFNFNKINYIYSSSISEEDKIKAREKGISEIVQRRQKNDEEKKDKEMRTFSGGLKTLVKMTNKELEQKEKERDEKLLKLARPTEGETDENNAEYVEDNEANEKDNLTKEAEVNPKENLGEDNKYEQQKELEQKNIEENEIADELKEKEVSEQIRYIKDKFVKFFPIFSQQIAKFYFFLTEIIVPQKGKTRKDGWLEMKNFLFTKKKELDTDEKRIKHQKLVAKRKAIAERFWISLEEVIDVLAAVFLAYLIIGIFSLYVEIPRMSELSEVTLKGSLKIHFLTGSFIFVRFLILIREKFTSWSVLRTSILFIAGSIVIAFAGINLL